MLGGDPDDRFLVAGMESETEAGQQSRGPVQSEGEGRPECRNGDLPWSAGMARRLRLGFAVRMAMARSDQIEHGRGLILKREDSTAKTTQPEAASLGDKCIAT